ncbi:MAG: right-handed parallel beta-helix repeat-containing protein [Gemmataceae bacterium]
MHHILLLLALAADGPRTFHVAPAGKDDDPGTAGRPFATVSRARDAVRALRRTHPGPVTVTLRGGTYRLAAPFELTPEDSGTAAGPVVYAAHPGETPVLSGGRPVTGWKRITVGGRELWAAEVPDARGRPFHQLWVNGVRRTRARHPNAGFLTVAELPGVTAKTPTRPGQDRFRYAPGDLKRWDNLGDVDVVVLHLWVGVRMAVAALDEGERVVSFVKQSRRMLKDGPRPARYFVENALELLDAPGEWYLDRHRGVVYYHPADGERFPDAEVIAPALPSLVRLAGRPEKGEYVEHVTLRGLTFAHGEWWPERGDTCDIQAAAPVPAAVHGDGVRRCVLDRCAVVHASTHGVQLARGCSANRIERCEFHDLGAGGVLIGEMTVRKSPAEQTHGNAVTDCHIHDVGKVFPQAVGVWVGQSFDNRIAHNHIHDLTYTGITAGWTWGYGPSLARDNRIEGNLVHDIGKGLLSDMAGVYTLGKQPGTVIRGNVFRDISAYQYGGWGIYFDEGSSDIVAENNLVYRTTHGGFHQHYGKDNVVRNNLFALGRDAQLRRSKGEPHRSFTFERNVVYYERGKLLDGNWDGDGYSLDRNLYFRAGGAEDAFAKWSLAGWRGRGQDANSVWADPGFADPAKGDFRLKPGGPAAKVGFVPFAVDGAGPRGGR